MHKRVFVIGGTGALGPHAIRALLDEGHEMTALARSDHKAGALARMGAIPVFGSMFDATSHRMHHLHPVYRPGVAP